MLLIEHEAPDRLALRESGLPRGLLNEIKNATFGATKAQAAARDWLDGKHCPGLCLTGKSGTGKTVLAAATAYAAIASSRTYRTPYGIYHDPETPVWISMARVMVQLRGQFGDRDREGAQRLMSADGAAVFDDLDKINATPRALEIAFAALDARMQAGSRIIITTNLDIGSLSTAWPQPLGEAIASRIIGYCRVVEMAGKDMRLKNG